MYKTCWCGKEFFVKPYLLERKKYCSKKCFYKYRTRPHGLTYKLVKENPTSFRKGQKPWNTGLREELQPSWAGDEVKYDAIHGWVERKLGKARKCDFCGTEDAKKYDWSNKTHTYKRELSDWQRLCVKCHYHYDQQKFGTRTKKLH